MLASLRVCAGGHNPSETFPMLKNSARAPISDMTPLQWQLDPAWTGVAVVIRIPGLILI